MESGASTQRKHNTYAKLFVLSISHHSFSKCLDREVSSFSGGLFPFGLGYIRIGFNGDRKQARVSSTGYHSHRLQFCCKNDQTRACFGSLGFLELEVAAMTIGDADLKTQVKVDSAVQRIIKERYRIMIIN